MLGTTLNFPGYSIESQIYEGERTVVYKGIRDTDAMPVVIKLMQNEYPSFSEIIQFRNQYSIAKNLDIPGIVKPYSLQTYHNGYALFMEYGGISLKEWAKNNNVETRYIASLHDFLVVAIQIATIFDGLHRNRVIHKDIKPANILINPETKRIKIIDFSISSLLPRETQQLQNPNVLEGTLAYISPEQTGRMNRGIDYRTDFYSLGITFYELLTGELPFISDDPMELVHCHIVKQAASVNSINQNIPVIISNIIAKLMAKNAEDRYQSTLGLKHDLETCLYEYKETLDITAFELGSRDISDCFLIPEKLYGRENEVETLLKAFDRVSAGAIEIMLVAGFSGIGKTAVVNEVHKPIVRQRGYFIKGKYDQFQRNIPLGAFVQAFRDLMGQLLSESDAQIQEWKSKILDAVGENGQVIIEVIPELERIIGKQEPAPELSGNAAQNRFNLLFQKFTQVFTCVEHPLVIFLDDLQWADSVSLKLMELLMTDTGHLLLIGAYRDNEVNPTHSLMLTLDEIQKNRATINTITLSPLKQDDLNNLIADTLSCTISIARPLTELVYQKTKGNPFFSNQFLKSLYEDGLINFNFEVNHWECDIAQVKALALTNDVVEFMALQLQKLPSATQEILKLAACIGNQFDLTTLSIVYEKSQVDTASDLWKALQEGLILPISEVYKFYQGENNDRLTQEFDQLAKYRFLHDRVQQAAYSLIPDGQKQTTHLTIGQLLLHCSSQIEREEKLFDIVGHLNQGKELIVPPNERQALAQLNLAAGRKARTSTAYAAAMVYLQTGIGLLKPDCWLSEYDLTLNLYVAAAEAAYLNGDFEGMEQMTALVLDSSQTILDKIKVYEIQILARIAQSQMLEAIAVAKDALQQLGVELPGEPSEAKIGKALQAVNCQLQGRQIQELADLPLMTDATSQAAMQLLAMLFPAVLTGIPSLLPLLSSTMVSLSLQSGNTAASSVGYVIHGMVLCNFLGEVETGYAFGRLALNVLKNLNVQEHKSIVYGIFAGFIQHFQESESASIPMYKTAYSTGIEIGDFMNSGYAANGYAYTSFFSGAELSNLEQEMVGYSAALGQMKQYSAQAYVNVTRQMVRNFIETVNQPECLIGTAYDEIVMIPKHIEDNELTIVAMLYIDKILLAYHFGNYTAAIDYATQVKQYLMAATGVSHIPVLHLYAALSHLAIISTQKEAMQAEILAQVEIHQTTLQQRALHAPMNYLHKWYLLEAERQRVLGNKAEAIECYERAITLAKENEYVNEEALANELAAKFYLGWGKEKIAQTYLIEAYYCYARWGAKAKIEDLEKRYSKLLAPIFKERNIIKTGGTIAKIFTNTIHSTSKTTTSVFDLSGIIKASQAISSEIELEKLLSHLMEVILENAGAEKSVLLLLKDKKLFVEVTANSNSKQKTQINVFQHAFEDTQEVPSNIINYVKNTLEVLVIDDANTQPRWVADIYIQRQQPKSILCMPILNQSKLVGILYLENRPTIGAFTTDRVELLNLLVSQAAISLENARLYKQAQDNAQQLEKSLSQLKQAQLQLVQSEKMSALGNLVAGVAHEINNPVGFIAGNINPAVDYVKDVFGLLDLYQQEYPNPSDAITDEVETIDLDYVRSDLPKLLNSMKEGVTRIRSISNSLRTFSRADTENKVSFNIHDGIDSTILILKHRLKADENRPAIEVIADYDKLPQISCFPGQLNQVFMNLIANAIDALDESNHGRSFEEIQKLPNIIKITTRISDDSQHVIISIKDNGKGMSEETKQRIFDHLFTTKGVGEGTGLGLTIARQIIIEKHAGTIEVNSQLGQGAEFVITIPLK
jgi:predicted ATPase/signal transduction histidine kinase